MRYITASIFLSIFFLSGYAQSLSDFTWPNGAKAAVCLTYDDGLQSHLDNVAPQLKKYNFKATFFPTLAAPSIRNNMNAWKSLVKDGHELGNHTLYHPCRKSDPGMEWVEDYHDLDKYTVRQILQEIEMASSFLHALDEKDSRTFAYPCSHFHAGGVSFKDSLAGYATAARASSEEQTGLPNITAIDLYAVPSWAPNGHRAQDLIAYVEAIIKKKTLSTFTFHGVGADHMIISKSDHEELLKYLSAHRHEIWVTTFAEATDYVRAQMKK